MPYSNAAQRSLAALAMGLVAASAGAAPRYERASLFGTGYADKQVDPATWDVRGASATPDGGHEIALYRAADLARIAGATELRIIRQKITTISRTDRSGLPIMFIREVAKLRVRAIQSAADRVACEEADQRRCITIPVAIVLAQYGRSLGQGAGPYPTAIAARQVVTVGMALPPAILARLAARREAMATTASPPPAPTRPISPYELGRQQGRAALAASGQPVDD